MFSRLSVSVAKQAGKNFSTTSQVREIQAVSSWEKILTILEFGIFDVVVVVNLAFVYVTRESLYKID